MISPVETSFVRIELAVSGKVGVSGSWVVRVIHGIDPVLIRLISNSILQLDRLSLAGNKVTER